MNAEEKLWESELKRDLFWPAQKPLTENRIGVQVNLSFIAKLHICVKQEGCDSWSSPAVSHILKENRFFKEINICWW